MSTISAHTAAPYHAPIHPQSESAFAGYLAGDGWADDVSEGRGHGTGCLSKVFSRQAEFSSSMNSISSCETGTFGARLPDLQTNTMTSTCARMVAHVLGWISALVCSSLQPEIITTCNKKRTRASGRRTSSDRRPLRLPAWLADHWDDDIGSFAKDGTTCGNVRLPKISTALSNLCVACLILVHRSFLES